MSGKLTKQQAAKELGISPKTFDNWLSQGGLGIRRWRMGRRVFFDPAEIARLKIKRVKVEMC